MEIRPANKDLGSWVENLTTVRYALFLWICAFTVTLIVGAIIPGTTLMSAAMTAVGAAIGVTVIMSLMRDPKT